MLGRGGQVLPDHSQSSLFFPKAHGRVLQVPPSLVNLGRVVYLAMGSLLLKTAQERGEFEAGFMNDIFDFLGLGRLVGFGGGDADE